MSAYDDALKAGGVAVAETPYEQALKAGGKPYDPGVLDRAGELALNAWDAARSAVKAINKTAAGEVDVSNIVAPPLAPGAEAPGDPDLAWGMPAPTSFAEVKAAGVSAAAFPGDLLASTIAGLTGITELATGGGLEKAGKTIEATTAALSPTAAVQPLLSEETKAAQARQMTAVGAMIPPGGVVAQSAEALGVDEKYTPLVEAGTNILAIGGPTAWHFVKPSVLKALGPDRLYNDPKVRPLGEVLREEVDGGRLSPQTAADIVTAVWQTGDRYGIAFQDPNWLGKVLGAESPRYAGTVRAKGPAKLGPAPGPEPTPGLPPGPVPPPGPPELTPGGPLPTPMPAKFPIKPGVDFQETWPTPPSRALPEGSGVGIWNQATGGRPGTVINPNLPVKGRPGQAWVAPPSNLPPPAPPATPVAAAPQEAPPSPILAPEAPAAPTAAPGTPEFYKAEADRLGVKFVQMWDMGGGMAPVPMFEGGPGIGNINLKPGESLEQGIARNKAVWEKKNPPAPPPASIQAVETPKAVSKKFEDYKLYDNVEVQKNGKWIPAVIVDKVQSWHDKGPMVYTTEGHVLEKDIRPGEGVQIPEWKVVRHKGEADKVPNYWLQDQFGRWKGEPPIEYKTKAEAEAAGGIKSTPGQKFEEVRKEKVSAKQKAMNQTPIARVRKGGGIKWNDAIAGEIRTYASRKEGGNKATALQMLFRRPDKNPKGYAKAMGWDAWIQTFAQDGTLPADAGIGDLFDLLLENKKGAGAGVKSVDEEKLAAEFEQGKEKREAETKAAAKAETERKADLQKELDEERAAIQAEGQGELEEVPKDKKIISKAQAEKMVAKDPSTENAGETPDGRKLTIGPSPAGGTAVLRDGNLVGIFHGSDGPGKAKRFAEGLAEGKTTNEMSDALAKEKGQPFKLETEEAPTAEAPLIPEVAGEQSELFPGERAKIKLPEKPAPAPPPQGGLFGPPKKPGILDNERGAVNLDFLVAMVEAGDHIRLGVKRLLFPTGISAKHLTAAEIISSKVGRMNRAASMAVNVLKKDRRMFDKLGVNNEKIPLKNNTGVKFMSDMSVGRTMTPEMQKIADKATALFQNRIKRLAAAGAPMAKVRENYFPGMWKDKTAATAFLSKRPFKGGEQFRKEKVFQDIMDGIDAGLEPISNNPIDLVLLKLNEMDRSIMANETLRELEGRGLIRFKSIFKEMPEGFNKIDDKYGTVFGPPHVAVEEYIDQHLYDGLLKIAESLGIKHERKINAGRGALGWAMRGTKEIVTQFATEITVLAHEISHQLDFKYDLWDKIVLQAEGLGAKGKPTKAASQKQRGLIMKELRALSDLKWEGQPASSSHKAYVRKKVEQMAHLLEAYIHAPERFRDVAPTVYESFDKFLREMPELKAFTAVKPGLTLTRLENEKGLPGFPLIGHRVATEAVADVLNNYLSRSMYNNPYFGLLWKGVMASANTLNQTQLGVFSGFHGGFTSFEVQISAGANVLKDIWGVSLGNRTGAQLAHTLGHWPKAMGSTARLGSKLLKEWDQPGTQGAKLAQIAEAAELAGANFKLEQGLRTEQTEKMIQDWYSEHKVRAVLRSPISLLELGAKPIMEWLVPRQKAGVFAELAGRIIEQNPGKPLSELRPLFRQAWNRVDARLGQVAYNRLFMNNTAKNIMQGLIRAPGWTGGTIAEVGGSIPDTVRFVKEWYTTGEAPKNIPDRVAYTLSLLLTTALANGLLTYAFTGEKPEGMDYWAFRDGGVDEYGKPTRFLLPTYMKDVYAWYKKPKHTAVAKIHPALSVELEIRRGTDYYGTQIANPEDNWFAQQVSDMKHRAKAFVPFWMRGTAKVIEREGGWKEAAKSPLKTVAPLVGIMPATAAYTRTEAEKLMGEMGQARRPLGGSTQDEADYAKLRARTLRLLRLGKKYEEFPNDMKEALDKLPENKLELIEKEAETTWLSSRFNRRTVNEKIRVWKVMSPKERAEVADVFWTAIDKHYDAMDDDDPEKELFKEKVEKANAAAEKNK